MKGVSRHRFRANLRVLGGSPQRTLQSRRLIVPQADGRRETQEAHSTQFAESSLTTGRRKEMKP
jgi:hypothetical protein